MAGTGKTEPHQQLDMEDYSPAHLCIKQKKDGDKWRALKAVLIVCFVTLPAVLLFLCGGDINSTLIWLREVKITAVNGLTQSSNQNSSSPNNNYLHALIPPNFDKESCLSRYEDALYRKVFPFMPSSYLVHKLRNYEALHKKCGPNTPLYWKSIQQLNLGQSMDSMDCNYVVWIPHNGLGNRILSLTSTFLYAILTNRVLLVYQPNEMFDLFCEPFPNTSWILPPDFPIKDIHKFNVFSNVSYGNMLDKHVISNDTETKVESLPSYVYAHLVEDYHHLDKLFFCNDDQIIVGKVNWLLLKSDLYFVPSLYFTPLFEEELGRLFPIKTSIFYLLTHYLIHPSNTVWKFVTRYYMSYLAKADEKIGIQVRVFPFTKVSSDVIFQQILNCSQAENIFPEIDLSDQTSLKTIKPKSKAILIVSLYSEYYEKFKSMYYEHSVKTGDYVSVYQPSHEEKQKTENHSHNQKALAEIYLLSLCDVLMTSGWSTFGYVSYGIAGIKPITLMPIWDKKIPDQPCFREVSMDPCHLTPPNTSCSRKAVDKQKLLQYVKPCQDDYTGIKLFD